MSGATRLVALYNTPHYKRLKKGTVRPSTKSKSNDEHTRREIWLYAFGLNWICIYPFVPFYPIRLYRLDFTPHAIPNTASACLFSLVADFSGLCGVLYSEKPRRTTHANGYYFIYK